MIEPLSGFGEARALDLLSAAVRPGAPGGIEHPRAEVQAVLTGGLRTLTRFANSTIIQNMVVDDRKVVMRAVVDGRTGTVDTTDLSPAGLASARARAIELAAASRGAGKHPGLAGPERADRGAAGVADDRAPGGEGNGDGSTLDGATLGLTPAQKAESLGRVFRRADKDRVLLAGRYNTGLLEFAVANSRGVARYHASSVTDAKAFALDGPAGPGTSSSYAGAVAVRAADVDLDAISDVAIRKCLMAKRPEPIEPGAHDALLEPEAVVELLEWLSSIGFTSRSFEEQTSFQYGRLGEAVTGTDVTIADDPGCRSGVGIPSPFDWEGVTRRPVTFVERGVARGVVHDLRSAAVAGCASTGHAVGGGPFPDGTAAPSHVTLAPGRQSREELLAGMERGLWITRFHYVNGMLDPRRAVMTGLTRDGTFRVVDGKVAGAVTNLRFTDSILEAFGRIAGIGRELRAVPTWWSELGAFAAPPILVRGLVFTGRQRE